jgi:hypothetical protein
MTALFLSCIDGEGRRIALGVHRACGLCNWEFIDIVR